MQYKLLVLDIDGTVANTKKEISEENVQAVIAAQKKGVKVVVASGRATPGVMPTAKKLKLDEYGGYILSFNGARIVNVKTGAVIYEKNLPDGAAQKIYAFAKKNKVNICTYNQQTVMTPNPQEKYVNMESHLLKMPLYQPQNFLEEIPSNPVKFLLLGDGEKLALLENKAKEEIGEGLNIFRSEPYFLEVMPQNIDKAYSLNKLLSKLLIRREEMMACGDGYNDLSMIQFAGLGVAMQNAQEAVKQAADVITDHCDNHGVAKAIETYILNT
ncbi:MAG: Cof-type HAD-IIB family hydrolase [Oscillospiraceae bacterium]|nr:Cof-type HAD-IIB family hydrolase [Oscillospiraceae bacterium]